MDYIKNLRSMVGHEKVIMVIAGTFVFDKDNRLLLQQRSDTGEWGLPGSFMELGENFHYAARREVLEETGFNLGKLELFGIYSTINRHAAGKSKRARPFRILPLHRLYRKASAALSNFK
ncbi:NUDIX domain-containing protein [Planococcus liqunii]|uniref:NUDIX domain-containing protein n=1 Tax=Planococcus liqunii TaxID=3058394 RepID=UPI00387EAB8E